MIPLLILTALLIVVPVRGQTRAETSSPSSPPSVITEPKSGARYRQIPAGHGPKSQRVLRGGSWYTPPAWLRASDRGGNRPSQTSSDYGFRCALDLLP